MPARYQEHKKYILFYKWKHIFTNLKIYSFSDVYKVYESIKYTVCIFHVLSCISTELELFYISVRHSTVHFYIKLKSLFSMFMLVMKKKKKPLFLSRLQPLIRPDPADLKLFLSNNLRDSWRSLNPSVLLNAMLKNSEIPFLNSHSMNSLWFLCFVAEFFKYFIGDTKSDAQDTNGGSDIGENKNENKSNYRWLYPVRNLILNEHCSLK